MLTMQESVLVREVHPLGFCPPLCNIDCYLFYKDEDYVHRNQAPALFVLKMKEVQINLLELSLHALRTHSHSYPHRRTTNHIDKSFWTLSIAETLIFRIHVSVVSRSCIWFFAFMCLMSRLCIWWFAFIFSDVAFMRTMFHVHVSDVSRSCVWWFTFM